MSDKEVEFQAHVKDVNQYLRRLGGHPLTKDEVVSLRHVLQKLEKPIELTAEEKFSGKAITQIKKEREVALKSAWKKREREAVETC